ncbi:YkgJ family cysteine cluster protein [Mangrovibacterium lignilyticum]|uniref:YkgJ family cysteine cluster protein n=1 Tax=Mangrovibacterium lignilyticum TaxID=2668052 RepID=UPI0013D5A28A|nr:YkgJ family cysteine cluster protein [Mangrovibacterium lignilyticum]
MSLENLTEHEKLFFDDGFQLGKQAAENKTNEKAFLDCVNEAYKAIDGLIDSILAMAKKENVTVDCKNGCAYCCHQAVYANSFELHYLGNFISQNFTPDQQEEVKKKAKEKKATTEKLSHEEVLKYKSPCPLLKNGSCTVYAARPMACRIYLSMKLNTCIEFYKNPDNSDNYPLLLEFPLTAGRMMNEGFSAALKESGIEIAEFRLEDGLSTVLTNGAKL